MKMQMTGDDACKPSGSHPYEFCSPSSLPYLDAHHRDLSPFYVRFHPLSSTPLFGCRGEARGWGCRSQPRRALLWRGRRRLPARTNDTRHGIFGSPLWRLGRWGRSGADDGSNGRCDRGGVIAQKASAPGVGQRPGRASFLAKAAGGRRRWCRIGVCSSVGGEGGSGAEGPMVDGVEGERLREGRRLRTIGGGGGGRRVWPRRAGRKYL
jgi:hypothetical protein